MSADRMARNAKEVLMEVSWRNPLSDGSTVYPVTMEQKDLRNYVHHGEFVGLLKTLNAQRPDTIKISVNGDIGIRNILGDPIFRIDHGAYVICSNPDVSADTISTMLCFIKDGKPMKTDQKLDFYDFQNLPEPETQGGLKMFLPRYFSQIKHKKYPE